MRIGILLAALCATAALPLRSQSPQELLSDGITAYETLELGNAAAFLRRALGVPRPAGLDDPDRARALSYLAAVEVLRNNSDSAASAFRQLLLDAPRFRPDPLVFASPVLNLFEATRRETKAVALVVPDSAEIRFGSENYRVRAYASSSHDVAVTINRLGGALVRELYHGPLGDSLAFDWNGRTAEGDTVSTGDYLLRATSHDASDDTVRVLQVPLSIERITRETVPLPPRPADSLLRPEGTPAGPSLRALLSGASIAGAAAILPSVVGADDAAGTRFAVTAAVGLAGIVGFIAQRPRPIPANIAANREILSAWREEYDAAVRENQALLEDMRLRIQSGTPARIERERP